MGDSRQEMAAKECASGKRVLTRGCKFELRTGKGQEEGSCVHSR